MLGEHGDAVRLAGRKDQVRERHAAAVREHFDRTAIDDDFELQSSVLERQIDDVLAAEVSGEIRRAGQERSSVSVRFAVSYTIRVPIAPSADPRTINPTRAARRGSIVTVMR